MHLGFHYHIPARIVDGKIYTIGFQGLFIDHLASHFEQVTLFMYQPLPHEVKELDYQIQSPNVRLVSLMKHYKIPVRIMLYPTIRHIIRKMAGEIDILLVRAPTPLLPLIIKDIQKSVPYAILVVGEMSQHVDSIQQKQWRKSLIWQYVKWNESRQEKWAKDALVFCNSQLTFQKFNTISNHCKEIRTTTLSDMDFYYQDDRCQNRPVEILFTGRIEKGKGILDIIQAIGILTREGFDLRLNIVGWAGSKDTILEQIRELSVQNGIADRIVNHGFKKAGEELFSFYKSADIFIVASQENEGFPRTIWESLAHSVPVIAVPVGSIPHFLKDGYDALFVERKNPEDISRKIMRLINEPDLRKSLIRNGWNTVKEVTLEIQSKKMADALRDYVNREK